MSWLGRQTGRVVGTHQPSRHMSAACLQMRDAGIDMIPAKLRVSAFAKRRLDIWIKLAEIMKRRRIHDSIEEGDSLIRLAAEVAHLLGAQPGTLDDAVDVIRVELRSITGSRGRVGEWTSIHSLSRGLESPVFDAKILERG